MDAYQFFENGDSRDHYEQVPIAFTVTNGMCDTDFSCYNAEAVPVYNENSSYSLQTLQNYSPYGYVENGNNYTGLTPHDLNPYAPYNHYNSDPTSGGSYSEGWLVNTQVLEEAGSTVADYNIASSLFRCVQCNTVATLALMVEHYLVNHVKHILFSCPLCPFKHCLASLLSRHLLRVHQVEGEDVPHELREEQPLYHSIYNHLNNLKNIAEGGLNNKKAQPDAPNHKVNSLKNRSSSPTSSESSEKTYHCQYCPYFSTRKDIYIRHEATHTDEKQFHCYICKKEFTRADHAKKHLYKQHNGAPYDVYRVRKPKFLCLAKSAPQSPQVTPPSTPKLIAKPLVKTLHVKQEDTPKGEKKKNYSCTQCNWKGSDTWTLKRHVASHMQPFTCPLCPYEGTLEERLVSHVFKKHKQAICPRCNHVADTKSEINKHVCRKTKK